LQKKNFFLKIKYQRKGYSVKFSIFGKDALVCFDFYVLVIAKDLVSGLSLQLFARMFVLRRQFSSFVL